ncbi:MAG: fibrobacter succinogenes major paralogous domain-containing protein [Mediterranea sp.]|jgi:hypothetical protein|nr:fibrobacter succinogenes major paralogous domain-containing protein [Mediterranea sp.]
MKPSWTTYAVTVLSLSLPLAGCDRELDAFHPAKQLVRPTPTPGDTATVRIRPSISGFATGAPTRAIDGERTSPTRINEDLTMALHIRPPADPPSTRATVPHTGTVRILAYASGDDPAHVAPAANKSFRIENGEVAETPEGEMHVKPGTYDFYLITPDTLKLDAGTVSVPQGVDAAWGKLSAHPVESANGQEQTLEATLDRQCACLVVRITGDNRSVTAITDATLAISGVASPAEHATATLPQPLITPDRTGTIDASTAPATRLNRDTGNAYTWISDTLYLLPQANPTLLGHIKLKINGDPDIIAYDNVPLSLPGGITVLEAGSGYTLAINVSTGLWAASNIYWNGTTLTFDKFPKGNEGYQGVYFRWGSLVGAGVAPDGAVTKLYAPLSTKGPNTGYVVTTERKQYGSVLSPNPNGNAATAISLYKRYAAENDGSNHGDICAYLTYGQWRLPTIQELNTLRTDPGDPWQGDSYDYSGNYFTGDDATSPTGTSITTKLWGTSQARFPASGFVDGGSQRLSSVGSGYYWSSSDATNVRVMYFDTHTIDPSRNEQRDFELPVRCIRNR